MNFARSRRLAHLPVPTTPPESLPASHGSTMSQGLRAPSIPWPTTLILLGFFDTWFLILLVNRNWIPVLGDILRWIANPQINYSPIEVHGLAPAAVATVEISLLGTLASMILLPANSDKLLRRITAIAWGFGFTGLVVVGLGIRQELVWATLNLSMLYAIWVFILIQGVKERFSIFAVLHDLREGLSIWSFHVKIPDKITVLFLLMLLPIIGSMFYHAVASPILHFDATTYHAESAKILYYNHGMPVIAGPGVGIEMSANFPPLFPSLGAFYYVQIGAVDDIYLRLLSPIMAVLLLGVVFQIGTMLKDATYAKIAVLLLSLSPLFIVHSMYAIAYLPLTLFVTLGCLLFLTGVKRGERAYWLASGICLGFALLVSYQGFFFVLAFAAMISALIASHWRPEHFIRDWIIPFGFAAFAIGSIWYLRNWVVLGNPVYPFGYKVFGGRFIDPQILSSTIAGVHDDSVFSFFGTFTPGLWDWIVNLLLNRSLFPALSIVSLAGLAMGLRQQPRQVWGSLVLFTVIPALVVTSTISNIFARYFTTFLPGFALLTALPLSRMAEESEFLPTAQFGWPRRTASAGLGIFLVLTCVFPTSLAVFGGQEYPPVNWALPGQNYLIFLRNPGISVWDAVEHFYGDDGRAWKWLDEHLGNGSKVATYETQIYYINDGNNDSFFYLDGWEARSLYSVQNPQAMVDFLRAGHVQFVLDASWTRHWTRYSQFPLTHFFGDPAYFPLIYGSLEGAPIYQVGKLKDSLTELSPLALSFFPPGLSAGQPVLGREARAIRANSDSIRLYVETPPTELTKIELDYLDFGKGTLSINLKAPNAWIYDEATLQVHNSEQWKTFTFTLPSISNETFIELGLYAHSGDVLIGGVRAYPSSP
jgi:4-amino-4-deoxy-L-arabinose transferase-like glycosyltransferase